MTPLARPWSLRRRLTGRVLALVISAWLATIAIAAVVMDHEMNEMFDEELEALVETTVLFLDTAQDGSNPRTLGVQTTDDERVLCILAPGQPAPAAPWPELAQDGMHDLPGWRVLRRSAEGAVIEAAHATSWRREELGEAAWAFLALVLPLVALLLWGLRRTVTTLTNPVSLLATSVSARSPDDLSPMGTGTLPRELHPLAVALDGYLARIGSLRQSERDFAANAAHELRTPLAALRSRLELSADPDAVAAVGTLDALTRRVERLLQLSRLEAGVGIGRGPSDLIRILHLLIDEARPRARHPLHFDDGDLTSLSVASDADALAILLRNLIENALDHGTGEVRITVTPDRTLTIENPTNRSTPLPERHQRGEGSAGSGLGLSIIMALAKVMDITLTHGTSPGAVRFVLRLPARAGSAGDAT